MNNYKNFFKNKNITLMRIGLLGRGIGDAAFLAECGAHVLVVDDASRKIMQPAVNKLKKYKNIRFKFGKYDLNDFRNCDFVLKGAGTPFDSVEIAKARKNNIPIEMSATLFSKLAGLPIIGVTGTRGKSTVTHLIAHILESAGKKIILGGNVRGVSNLQLLKKVKNAEVAVLELDSWQLQGFGEDKISPNIAVFTTFLPDHMGYYNGSMEKYFADKANIFKYQKKEDILIVGKQALPFVKRWGGKIKSKIIVGEEKLPKSNKRLKFNLPGLHNEYNAMLAVEVARSLDVKDNIIKKALEDFKSVEGRLQFLREVKGVKYYNDTTATTPEATIAAMKALGHPMSKLKNIILIAGGSDKGLDMSNLIKEISKYCKKVILLSGSGTNTVKDKIKNAEEVDSLKSAVKGAREYSRPGDIILLSPAFASFGMFKNEYDRGDQFMKIVKSLK